MKAAPFEYHAPASLDEAVSLLASLENARVLAGGQSLVPMMNFRYLIVDHLIDLNNAVDMAGIAVEDGQLVIGAMTRQVDLECSPLVAERCPLIVAALRHVGHRQTRNRGTIGGSLAHADPAAELPAVCATLDAELDIKGPGGVRRLPFREFATGFMSTALDADEILARVRIPLGKPATGTAKGCGLHEFARRHGDFAVVGCAAAIEADRGRVGRCAVTLFGVATTPQRRPEAEAIVKGEPIARPLLEAAARKAADLEMISDIHASADYRRHLAHVLAIRALTDAARAAGLSRSVGVA